MKTYLNPIFAVLVLSFCFFQTLTAQTDTPDTSAVDLPVVPFEEAPSEFDFTEDSLPSEEWGFDEVSPDFEYTPSVKKYDFEASFAYGFASLSPTKSAVASKNGSIGRYLPQTTFFGSDLTRFELNFGRNLSKGIWRFWFGLGIEDESFRFVDANVRLQTRVDSFAHQTLDPTDPASIGKEEDSKESSLYISSVTVPLAISYQNKSRRPTFKIKIGAHIGYRYTTQSSVKYGDDTRVTVTGNFHVNPYIVDPFASFQYKSVGIFARTSVLPLLHNVGAGNEQMRHIFGLFVGF
jgi:hypothetical protein